MAKPKGSERLLTFLNRALARELQVTTQYMWQHVLWSGVKGLAVKGVLRSIAIVEMVHAEVIAERIAYLGGELTTEPAPIFIGKNLKEMIEQDVKDEEEAIKLYKQIIELAGNESDETTQTLFRGILADEEGHHDTFTSILEEM